MLSLKRIIGAAVAATDGEVGALRDAYLSEQDWVVHTLIIEPTAMERTVPLALRPAAVHRVDPGGGHVELTLSLAQVDEAPAVDLRRPPGRAAESGGAAPGGEGGLDASREERPPSSASYSPSAPWGPPATIGDEVLGTAGEDSDAAARPGGAGPAETEEAATDRPRGSGQETSALAREERSHSARGMIGHTAIATDGEVGTVDDLLVDPESWRVDFLVVAISGWVSGIHAPVASADVRRVDTGGGTVHLGLAVEEVRAAAPRDGAPSGC
ncbi:MAG: hypothetical protein V2J16_07805 [Thermoleophilia bacterium]|jgi:sporulation protein YlmC with PRC-barrel domain|nr:hypothetical protein [Thermoleophilia bacterium]